MKVDLEVGKFYTLSNRKTAYIVFRSPTREEPYLAVVLADGYDEDMAVWYNEEGRTINDDYTIVAELVCNPFGDKL